MTDLPPADRRPAILSALLALALYAVTLGGTYVYDDRYIVLQDPRVGDVSRWHEYWTKDYFNGGADNLYRPLVSMTYAVQTWLHGNGERSAWAFHLVNWLLHAAASALVAEFARRATRSSKIALLTGLLFAAHPIHVEVVANIIGRAETMCAIGVLGSLILYLRPLTAPRAMAIWACIVFAILSKEQGLLIPLMLLLALPLRRSLVIEPPTLRRFSGPTLLLFSLITWTLAGYIVFRESILKFWWDRSFLDRTINPIVKSIGLDRMLMPFALLGRYIALFIAPARLAPDYGGGVIGSYVSLSDPYFVIGIISATALLVACAIAAKRRSWIVLFCLGSFALLFGMIGNIATLIGTNFGERLLYSPLIFLCLLAALALCKLPKRVMTTLAVAVVLLFSIRTVSYAARWNDPPKLFRTAIVEQPKAIRLYLLLAEEQHRGGDLAGAIATLTTARAVDPDYYRAWLNSGHLAMEAKKYDDAVDFARKAQQLAPTFEGERLLNEAKAAAYLSRPTSRPVSE